jgi:hypothetical protein
MGLATCVSSRRVPGILVDQSREQIQLRDLRNEQPVLFERALRLQGLEETLVGRRGLARTGEDRDAVRRGIHLFLQIGLDLFHVLIEASPLCGPQRVRSLLRGELLSDERQIVIAPARIGAGVEIQTQNGQLNLDSREPVESLHESIRASQFDRHDSSSAAPGPPVGDAGVFPVRCEGHIVRNPGIGPHSREWTEWTKLRLRTATALRNGSETGRQGAGP